MPVARPSRAHLAAALLAALVALLLLAAPAAAAPSISGADGDVWNAETVPATYVVTGSEEGALLSWQLRTALGPVPGFAGTGPSPLTVTLDGAPDGRLFLVAGQTAPLDPGEATRAFTIDTTPPLIGIDRPREDAVYDQGARIVADFRCRGASTCVGTVADGSPIDTSAPGPQIFTVTSTDAAGNRSEQRVAYRVAAAAAPAGSPPPPAPPIRLAPPSPADPGDATPEARDASRLRPPVGATLNVRRPVLRWTKVPGARLYNVQVFRVRGTTAVKVLSDFPRGTRLHVPRGRLAWDERYAWRVWPLVKGSYTASPHGQSWFDVRRPVRLSAAQLLVNQRISQAALRRTAAIQAWLDAGLVAGDLRDGGLGREDFSGDVTLSGDGTAIDNGLASPRPVVTAAASRSGKKARLRVSAAQLLVNQRISQAAVRRANALERRIGGGLTGGDLVEGAVVAQKLAPGLRVARTRPSGSPPPASVTAIAPAPARGNARVRLTARQVLINQRISQAAVRRANAMTGVLEGGLTGRHFRDGAISARAVSADQRG